MQKREIKITVFSNDETREMYTFDKEEINLIIEANKKLAELVEEKDKEIEKLKNNYELTEKLCELLAKHDTYNLNVLEIEKETRHQVCEEIRLNSKQDIHRGVYTISYADLYRIEKKGESK